MVNLYGNRRRVYSRALVFAALLLLLWQGWTWRSALWNRVTGAPQILYLREDAAGITQLYATDQQGRAHRGLTQSPDAISGFAVSPNAAWVAYTTSADANGSDGSAIWLADKYGRSPRRLLACPDALCHYLTWAPDSRRLIYERRPLDAKSRLPGAPHLWWLDTVSGETVPVLAENDVASGAALSPDSKWIAYAAAGEDAVQVYAFDTGRAFQVPSQVGSPPVWHPAGNSFLVQDLNVTGDEGAGDVTNIEETEHFDDRHIALGTHLFVVDLASGKRQLLSARVVVDDGSPAWSPDGEWIAFGRRQARTDAGRQLWLMRADGSNPRVLTTDTTVHHGPPNWSEDGRFLLFQRFDGSLADAEPGIWLLEVETGQMHQLAEVGFLPAWMP